MTKSIIAAQALEIETDEIDYSSFAQSASILSKAIDVDSIESLETEIDWSDELSADMDLRVETILRSLPEEDRFEAEVNIILSEQDFLLNE